jgi:hypothetical protein
MAKRRTIKPVKAWGLVKANGEIECDTGWRKTLPLSFVDPKGIYTRLVRVTVSVDDPASTRIGAAQRRVVEAAVKWGATDNPTNTGAALHALSVEVQRLERAKGDRK